jgi:hypothetical protein
LVILATVVFTPGLQAADADSIIDGRWEWSNDVGNAGIIESVLMLHSDGEKLTGKYQNQMHSAEITEGKIDDINVWFSMTIETDEGDIEASFAGEFIDGELSGEIAIGRDGETMEVPWEPKRFTRQEDVVGTWDFEFTAPDGNKYEPKYMISTNAGKLSGTVSANESSMDLKNVKLADNKLTFDYAIDYNGSDLALKYTCHPRGHKMVGSCSYSVDGNEGTFDVSGKKQVLAKQLQAMVGAWNCAVTGPDGIDYNPILTVQEEDGKLTGRIATNELDMAIKEIVLKDGKVTFDFTTEHENEGSVKLTWVCSVDGDDLRGKVKFQVAGQDGEIDVTGTRIKDD